MPTYPLVPHSTLDNMLTWRDGTPVSACTFLADAVVLAAMLSPGGHVFDARTDRYRFVVGLGAALVAGKVSLLPPMQTAQMVRQLSTPAPDVFCLHDTTAHSTDLSAFRYLDALASGVVSIDMPQIDMSQAMAVLFMSGSIGTLVPHCKTWGALMRRMRTAVVHLGLVDGCALTLVGVVPAQHVYGLKATVLLTPQGGLALSNWQPFYPMDIREALDVIPQPRVLVASLVYLRVLLVSEPALPSASLVLSITALLSEALARKTETRLLAPLLEIYGSTEVGQIAMCRTVQKIAWHLYPGVRMESRSGMPEDEGPTVWAYGGHVETPVPMGDAIELIDGTHFLLHGRKVDLINIAGKRSSLAYLNHQLNAIVGVVDGMFYMPDDVPAAQHTHGSAAITRLVALVAAPGLSAANVLRALHDRIDAAFMLRPLLLVDVLPHNETGKLAHDVLAVLIVQHSHRSAHKHGMRFTIPADHLVLPGHLSGHPVMSGVVLLDHVLHTTGAVLDRSLDACKISSAKFLSPAAPGEMLDLAFETTPSSAIRFTIRVGEREVASGVLPAPAPEGVTA